eukprot:gnl/TRDRNA2_/TRDRNA2_36309_c0_seq1.p1 gnl/TRDRNA2_/TRDRNA2_36309_c0~~gnl/TRDRNA2_/TRDRNA2_36309_c0_seq1.p1  ORF type:complete len:266 (-),score=71.92 gnl/TRDRNA2_/TRDRNA2_36309_c0_seq1:39-836(-)
MFRLVVGPLLFQAAHAGVAGQGNSALRTEGFVRALEFNYRLRACDAYPSDEVLNVFKGKERLTSDGAMPYKSCRDFTTPLKSGDKLEFKVGEASEGTFSVGDLPQNDAVLMIVVHRHDMLSTAMSFESHVFANAERAQVAVIDTYKGKMKSTPQIEEAFVNSTTPQHKEMLRYDSVVGVEQGRYTVELMSDDDKKVVSKVDLVALNKESYIVIRAGCDSKTGKEYPEEIIVFPESDPAKLPKSAAVALHGTAALVLLLVAAVCGY